MRSLVFILLITTVLAAPSGKCLEDFSKCTVDDFAIDSEAPKQCVPYSYDLENPTGPFGADVKDKRQQCAFWDWCIPNGHEYNEAKASRWQRELKIGLRKFTKGDKCGPDTNKECIDAIVPAYAYTQNGDTKTTIIPTADDAVLQAAIAYYNAQDYCRVSWLGLVFWANAIVWGTFALYWLIEYARLQFNAEKTIFGVPFENTTIWGDQSRKYRYGPVPVTGRKKRDLV